MENTKRVQELGILGVFLFAACLLFIAAFNGFRPDQKSLSDRYFPSKTPTFSPTPTLTNTPIPTATPNWTATQKVVLVTSTAQAAQTTSAKAKDEWNILLTDSFDNNDNRWTTGISDIERAKINRQIHHGKYLWVVTSKSSFIGWVTADTTPVTDFSLSVDLERTDGTTSSDYGVIFREDSSSNFYYVGIDSRRYTVLLRYEDEWITIIGWGISNRLKVDEPNRLTVLAQGSHFILLINDQFVAEFDDDHIESGTVGLAVSIDRPDLQAVFEFDNFEVLTP